MGKKPVEPDTSDVAAAMGRKGGAARAKALTKARRKEIASEAANARWAKVRNGKPRGPTPPT